MTAQLSQQEDENSVWLDIPLTPRFSAGVFHLPIIPDPFGTPLSSGVPKGLI